MFSQYSCIFAPDAKFKDKFVFNGGTIHQPQDIKDCKKAVTVVSESSTNHLYSDNCVLDWWILDCIRLRQVLPLIWYQPLADNPFLAQFRFHFFQLDEQDNSLISSSSSSHAMIPLDLIKNICKRFGASIANTIDTSTTHVVTQFQCEHLLPTQLLGPVQFVTLPWLLKVLNSSKYFEPFEAIDFPCPIHPIPSANDITVCLSGFPPIDRDLILSQLSLMGISSSPNLCPELVTHLICARFEGPKFELARKFNLKIYDRSWIDSCYKTWHIQS